ncbi:MAG TPA: tRNA (adenosine(37)-N6)-threonylcarbamoyltransferase complex dimerization subunit type 1 TsaB [Syntrophales bacterium]|nr:tRNA (adenosine(37)-N6)-threonylcarbamoyltransferase complex dimerization subunit type 1 TsaB [Syntrophales bacterium]HOX95755.1 tRNA (adenosine(37)-N6)-threonylcarbamoyltransferase complex dimerization subunit type 1 TsaB [Syntrophales bacterium]HPI55879.1 tRNA (adenosine(37)-N6)-threonylcarbamoyltransferase complex dimerization subunit type 1 TsaB [Syntrophales bacterium]HPN23630.1 tRNA (adenosine(37)-N6)-threonylcarbamoyltransferase complex dimerization subunit type 1 TsaB [Syntrophales ba
MITLAIDTATRAAGVALLQDENILAEHCIRIRLTHSESILPAIEAILSSAGIEMRDVGLFALTQGPGSFTGLRVGAGIVKGLALCTDACIVGVSTLDALAQNLAFSKHLVCPILDAKKGQVYTALYRPADEGGLEKIEPDQAVDPVAFIGRISHPVIFLGDGVPVYGNRIRELLSSMAFFAPANHQWIRPSAVGLLGFEKYHRGEGVDPVSFVPRYIRRSEAEIRVSGECK